MIERENYDDVMAFLSYQTVVRQRDPKTVKENWRSLRHLLEWADSRPLSDARMIEPTFSAYLLGRKLSAATATRVCRDAQMFLRWARRDYPQRYKANGESWIDSIRLARGHLENGPLQVQAWELEDVLRIVRLPMSDNDLSGRRDRSAVAFLFLSGMRAGAFVTTPISCVHVAERKVEQLPSKGVQTKNRKAAITSLLVIPELLSVVQEWDAFVRDRLPDHYPWYAKLAYGGLDFAAGDRLGTLHGRYNAMYSGIRRLCDVAKVPYLSPHKLRHGHVIWGMRRAKNISHLKAISQNIMHSNISITDGIYGNFKPEDVGQILAGLEQPVQPEVTTPDSPEDIERAVRLLLKLMPGDKVRAILGQ